MTSFDKAHPAVRNERGTLIDRLFAAGLAVLYTAAITTAVIALHIAL